MKEKDQIALLKRVRKGDLNAFKELYNHYAPIFKGIAYRYLGDLSRCDDAIQDAFVQIHKNLNTYTGKGNFEGWMKRILINKCLDIIKKEKRYIINEGDSEFEREAGWEDAVSAISFNELVDLINTLPDGYKAVFNLAVFEDYSHKDIGDLLGITESASRSQLTKAKALLRKKIEMLEVAVVA